MAASDKITVRITGPIFEAQKVRGVFEAYLDEVTEQVGPMVQGQVEDEFRRRFKESEGGYFREIDTEMTPRGFTVKDYRSEYGKWLEGTSRRNLSTSFGGYEGWRLAKLALDATNRVSGAIEEILVRRLKELE